MNSFNVCNVKSNLRPEIYNNLSSANGQGSCRLCSECLKLSTTEQRKLIELKFPAHASTLLQFYCFEYLPPQEKTSSRDILKMCRSQGNAITSYCKRKFLPHKQSKSHKNIYRAFSITQRLKWTVWGPILHKQPDIDQLRLVGQYESTSAGSHINNNILRKGRA